MPSIKLLTMVDGKSQYETQFKKWNYRKNLTASEWQYVQHSVRKQKLQGKDSIVLLEGRIVLEKKIKKARTRAYPNMSNERCFNCR